MAVSLSSSRDFSDQPKPRAWQISGEPKAHRNKFAALLKSHRADPIGPFLPRQQSFIARAWKLANDKARAWKLANDKART
jgi:hypothetical protein